MPAAKGGDEEGCTEAHPAGIASRCKKKKGKGKGAPKGKAGSAADGPPATVAPHQGPSHGKSGGATTKAQPRAAAKPVPELAQQLPLLPPNLTAAPSRDSQVGSTSRSQAGLPGWVVMPCRLPRAILLVLTICPGLTRFA